MNKQILILLLLSLLAALLVPVTSCQPLEVSKAISVAVTIPPQAEFVEGVAGALANLTVMVPPGASPHTYEPSPRQIDKLSKAKMYAMVGSGIDFELAWLDKLIATNKTMLVVDSGAGIQQISMTGGSRQGAMDPHIWMSPLNAQTMVKNIYHGLIQIDPKNKEYYEQNQDMYLKELTLLHVDIKERLANVKNRKFMVYHPILGYFARDYNLTMIPIEEEGKEPTAADIVRLIEQAKEYNIKVVFASPEENPQTAKVIAEAIGGRVVFISDMARDYIANLKHIANELAMGME